MCMKLSRSLTSGSASASALFSRGNVLASDDLIVWIRLPVVWL